MWGGMREPAIPSVFLSEIPTELLEGDIPLAGGAAIRHEQRLERLTRIDRQSKRLPSEGITPSNAVRKRNAGPTPGKSWAVGDKVKHLSFGEGQITHTFGSGEKVSIAVKFVGMGPKILDPRLAPIEPLQND